ncbi:uncharacterized protein TrAFT101_002519 [Trichoderma asperellum]|uniref:uncharacterized protein n=1 Tax=Trichoderma asperellum TaxID=101201 RepID=UPI00333079E6|nr:hypothetical protein TrAFT101_002519 [Trichoderma asperellum]
MPGEDANSNHGRVHPVITTLESQWDGNTAYRIESWRAKAFVRLGTCTLSVCPDSTVLLLRCYHECRIGQYKYTGTSQSFLR